MAALTSDVRKTPFEQQVLQVEARCLGASHHTRRRQPIMDVSDRIVGESAIVPTVYIQDKIVQMRKGESLTLSQRYERLAKAGQIYKEANLAGLEPDAYISMVANVTGLQKSLVAESMTHISHSLNNMLGIMQAATPAGAVWDYRDSAASNGCSLLSRRGDVVSIIAAGNGPGVHGLWPQAIAMGYRTMVRPSSREPFTAQRLICALELAGLEQYVALIPTDHRGVDSLIELSDLAIVYGGPEVTTRYGSNPKVLVQGPGRSKMVVGRDVDHEEAVTVVAESVLSRGGAACVCASAVLVEDDPYGFAHRLRLELEVRAKLQPLTLGRRREVDAYMNLLQAEENPWLYDHTSTNGYPLKPHVTLVKSATDAKVQRELPFPCITVAPFNRQEDFSALSGSLVVTLLSREKELIHQVLSDVSISNVYIGIIPTTWMDYRVPHDGYLADFLMCNRGLRVHTQWLKSS
ncbi:aldehyde dehydrogenase family protein [Microbulbifer variabilis]|uniref:aldehyde dehydrogenase family protein n=2 Tax=Microbulbifer TaxID=48073 RepID=UPI0003740136|nr:aldehyde dehydrogenase family protein [Microbulbifer variabilis]